MPYYLSPTSDTLMSYEAPIKACKNADVHKFVSPALLL